MGWNNLFIPKLPKLIHVNTVYPKKYAHGFCFAVLCCGYTLIDLPISIRLTSLALWQSDDCPSASKATLMNMDKYFMWIHYERLHNHNKAKHNKTCAYFLGYTVVVPGIIPSLFMHYGGRVRLITTCQYGGRWLIQIYVNKKGTLWLYLVVFLQSVINFISIIGTTFVHKKW